MTPIQDFLKNIPVFSQSLSPDELMLQAAELSRKAAEQLALERMKIRQNRANDLMGRSAIPSRFREADLNPKNPEQTKAYSAANDFVINFTERLKTGAGMVAWGDVGTGKTHMVCGIANALIAEFKPVLYCTALEAVMLVKSTWKRSEDGLSEYDVYTRFGEPQLLIIDEIGVQCGTEFERMVLTSIADIRSRNCLPTIIVSNLNPEEIYKLLGERMFDRLVGFGASVVNIPGKSLRLKAVR